MNIQKRVNHKLNSDAKLLISIIFAISLAWSWIFTSRVSELTDSVFFGYLCALLAYIVIVGFSSFIFYKATLFFKKTYLHKKSVSFWVIPLLFVFWAAVEYLVALTSALIWYGKDGSLDSVFPFTSFSPLAAHTPLVFLARLVGYHGLSAAVVMLMTVFIVKKLRGYALVTTAVVLLATFCSWVIYRAPTGPPIKALIVSESVSKVLPPVKGNYELAVFPEYGLSDLESGADRMLYNSVRDVYYVGSKQVTLSSGNQNVMEFGSAQRGIIEERAKSRLIPGGEYAPYTLKGLLLAANADRALGYFEGVKAVKKGSPNYTTLKISNDVQLGTAVCASIIATEDYRHFTQNGATILTNSASLGIFNSKLFTFEHQGLAKFMAVANARPFLQSAADADAFAVDHNGNMVAKTSPISSKQVSVMSNSKTTPYTLIGEWPVYVGIIALCVMGFNRVSGIRKFKNGAKNNL